MIDFERFLNFLSQENENINGLIILRILNQLFVPAGLDEEIIKSLEVKNYSSELRFNSDTCVVCYDDYIEGEEVMILTCRHAFHAECIKTWFKNSTVCPLCKSDMSG
jgi:hypothetical protein